PTSSTDPAELEPRPVKIVSLKYRTPTEPDLVEIGKLDTTDDPQLGPFGANALGAAVEGAFLVISDDQVKDQTGSGLDYTNEYGQNNGRVYRLGARRPDKDVTGIAFELAAGDDMASTKENLPGPGTSGKPIAFS